MNIDIFLKNPTNSKHFCRRDVGVKGKPLGPKVPSLCFLLYPCATWASHYELGQTLRSRGR